MTESGRRMVAARSGRSIRDESLDVLRALAAMCVVLYHLGPTFLLYDLNSLGDIPGSAAIVLRAAMASCVPIFFLVAGILYSHRSPSPSRCLRKAIKLIFLTLFWGIATWAVLAVESGRELSLGLCLSEVFQLKMGIVNHLWFLPALSVCYMILPVLCALRDEAPSVFKGVSIAVFVSAFGLDLLNRVLSLCGWVIDSVLPLQMDAFLGNFDPLGGTYSFTTAYLILGMYIGRRREPRRLVMLGLAALIGVLLLSAYGMMSMYATGDGHDVTWGGYGFVGTAVFCCWLYWAVKRACRVGAEVPPVRALALLGQNTLAIYLLHWMVLPIVRPLVFGFSGVMQAGVAIAAVVLTAVVSAVIGAILRKTALGRMIFSI